MKRFWDLFRDHHTQGPTPDQPLNGIPIALECSLKRSAANIWNDFPINSACRIVFFSDYEPQVPEETEYIGTESVCDEYGPGTPNRVFSRE
jgi:hypothetical protein